MPLFSETLFVDREKKLRGFEKILLPETRQSVMLIEAPEKMGKSWLAGKMQGHCRTATVGIPVARLDFRNPLDMSKLIDHLALIRLIRDRFELPDYFGALNATINRVTAGQTASTDRGALAQLAQAVQRVYNLDELGEFAAFAGIEFENLAGETRFQKAFALVGHFFRRGSMDELFETLREERGHIDWTQYERTVASGVSASDADLDAVATTVAATMAEMVVDQNSQLQVDSAINRQRAEREINAAFFDCVADIVADNKQVTLLFDSYEEAPQEAVDFILKALLPNLLDERLHKMIVIITGRKTPDILDVSLQPLLVKTDLDPFTVEHVRDFMAVRQINEDPPDFTWRGVHALSGGVPGDLALMADRLTASASQEDPFFA